MLGQLLLNRADNASTKSGSSPGWEMDLVPVSQPGLGIWDYAL